MPKKLRTNITGDSKRKKRALRARERRERHANESAEEAAARRHANALRVRERRWRETKAAAFRRCVMPQRVGARRMKEAAAAGSRCTEKDRERRRTGINNVLHPPSSSQDGHSVLNESSEKRSAHTIRSVIIDSCELFCQEEKLTPEQEKFQHEEWLKYVKFTANVQNLPNITVSNVTDAGGKVSDGVKSPQELPVLIYSNAPQPHPQPILIPPVPGSVSNPPILFQFPSNISAPFNAVTPLVTQCTLPSVMPPVFPVRLEKSAEITPVKPTLANSKDEEIFPVILQDVATENLFNKVKEASLPSKPLSPVTGTDKMDVDNPAKESDVAPSPTQSISDENGQCVSPDLLSHVEVSLEENEPEPSHASVIDENVFESFDAEGSAMECNGPKIVDVISGDAGASELFKGTIHLETDPEVVKDKDNSSGTNGILPENSMPKTVTQWSIFSMQKTIAVISSGVVEANVRNLLGVRLHIPPITTERDIATQLKNRLREENFLTTCAWWMVQKQYLPLNPPCASCGGKKFRMNSCREYLDGLCWVCDNKKCRKVYPVKRPKFFERFPSFSLEELLILTYHWACKSRIWVINYDVPVHYERIWSYFCALQELCGESVSKNIIGKNTKHTVTVEVSAVKLGNFFILCAYDRRNRVSRLQALTTEEACGSVKHIHILKEWLGNNVNLITWKKISEDFLPEINKLGVDPGIAQVQSIGRHILNASKYLGKTMVQIFQNICHEQLTLDIIQNVLNEVQWRERHGQNEASAFWGIMNEISKLNESYPYTEVILGDINKDHYFYKADGAFRLRWGPLDMGKKSSALTTTDKNVHTQQVSSKSVVAATNKVDNSCVSTTASTSKLGKAHIEVFKQRHPISVVSENASNASKEKTVNCESGISPQELLSIKMFFVTGNVFNDLQRQAEKLGLQLRDEGFLLNPVRWLLSKQYIKDVMPCYVCHGMSQLIDNPKHEDGVSWLCQKSVCRFENKYIRPSFFAYFGFKLDVIFSVIYHWAVQSDYETLIRSVPLNEFNIISIHRKLQKICSQVVKGPNFKIGGKKNLVEVAFVRFANCFILGAMERNSKHSRFRTFSNQSKLNIDEIRKSLISWLWEDSTVIVNSNKYLGRYCMEERINLVFADQTITDITSKKYHTLTITQYLQNHMKTMFRTLKVQHMSADLLQIYLDELIWRERYGRTPLNAFHSIMRCIFTLDKSNTSSTKFSNDIGPLESAAAYYGISLPLPEVKVALKRLSEHEIKQYTTRSVEDITIIDDIELTKEIKEEVISDDEIEILSPVPDTKSVSSVSVSNAISASTLPVSSSESVPLLAPNSKNVSTLPVSNSISVSPISPSPSTNQNCGSPSPSVSEVIPKKTLDSKPIDILVNKCDVGNKRYAARCYTHKKRVIELSDGKSRCMECKNIVSPDHFAKLYTCGDCKRSTYSTYCQKAFARHRSYILFGRNINPDDSTYNSNIILSEKWFCSCGFGSHEGNKLASHLIECEKTTCYLKSEETITVVL